MAKLKNTNYKLGQIEHPQSFEDRNLINDKIKYFNHLISHIEHLSKVVFQDATFSKNAVNFIINDKRTSSYPHLRKALYQLDEVVLDSPWKFAALCVDIMDLINKEIDNLENLRKRFILQDLPNKQRGWVEKHSK